MAGYVINRSGRILYHKWNLVALGGSVYLVDAQIEGSEYRRSGSIAYKYFFKTLGTYKTTPVYIPLRVTLEVGGRLTEQALDAANAMYSEITSLF